MERLKAQDLSLQSTLIDQLIKAKVLEIESELHREALKLQAKGNHHTWGAALHDGNQTWVGLDPETIQTPYHELKELCQILNPPPGSKMIDLGAGYGRLGIVLNLLYPMVKFIGYEYVGQRVLEGNRLFKEQGCHLAQLIQQDVASHDFVLPEADYYFIYDYGTLAHLRKTLRQIEEMADTQKFKVIARGKGVRSLIDFEHPWLGQVFDAHHGENYSIYSMSS